MRIKRKIESEKVLEKRLVKEVKLRGGLCLKYHNSFQTSLPDRIVLMPGGKIWFVELKSTNGKLSRLQEYSITLLRSKGFEVFVIDSQKGIDCFLEVVF